MTSSNNEGSHYFIDFKNSEKILNLKSYGGMIMQDTVALVVDDGAEIIVKYIKTDENEPT